MAARPTLRGKPAHNPPLANKWGRWYQPGSETDAQIYAQALQECKAINQNLISERFLEEQRGFVASKIRESSEIWIPRHYDAAWVKAHIDREAKAIQSKQASKKEWAQNMKKVADGFVKLVELLKPVIDIFVPQSPEYTVPYACIWIVFKGYATRKDKKDSILGLVLSLYDDIPVLEAYGDMFPTTAMKTALAEFYLQTADFLWRLARYYAKDMLSQLADALFPRTEFKFDVYQGQIKRTADRLKTLCDTGHVAEQKDIKDRVDGIASELHHLSEEIYQLSGQLESTRLGNAQRLVSELIDIWHEDVGSVEQEVQLWSALQLWTDRRDHWSENGTLDRLSAWRKQCDQSSDTILWVCSESNGRQSWMTELSVDLLRVCRTHGQMTTFALCDRPGDVKWTPRQVLQQLISQLLIQNPKLTMANPAFFCPRTFRRATTFKSTFRLLHTLAGMIESAVVVIDRLDLCVLDPEENHPSIVQALAILVKTYPKRLKIIITTARIVRPHTLPDLPISFCEVKTRRRPRHRVDDRPKRWMSAVDNRVYVRRARRPPLPLPPSRQSYAYSDSEDDASSGGPIVGLVRREVPDRVERRLVPHGG